MQIERVAVCCSFMVGGAPEVGWEGPWFHLRYGEATSLDGSVIVGEQGSATGTDLTALRLETYVNDELRSAAQVSDLMMAPARFLSYVSTFLTPSPAMLLLSGNPDGPSLRVNDDGRPAVSYRRDLGVEAGDRVRAVVPGVGAIEVEVRR